MPTLQKQDVRGNPFCEFCSKLLFSRHQMFERCKRYNAKAHVKKGRAYTGVKIVNYIVDDRTRVVEEDSKIISQLRFCPICGFDYVQQKKYDGKNYKTPFNINKLPTSWKDANERGQQESN